MCLDVLLRRGIEEHDEEASRRLRAALDGMRKGGIWDQLGGGFHRYSTDERWLVPHFEKMLYDNALLARLYADAWRATGEARYADVVRGIAAWMAREMTSGDGAFYATREADREGEEGKFFVWTPPEIDGVVAEDEARVAKLVWGVTDAGNFEHTGATVLSENRSVAVAAKQLGIEEKEAARLL